MHGTPSGAGWCAERNTPRTPASLRKHILAHPAAACRVLPSAAIWVSSAPVCALDARLKASPVRLPSRACKLFLLQPHCPACTRSRCVPVRRTLPVGHPPSELPSLRSTGDMVSLKFLPLPPRRQAGPLFPRTPVLIMLKPPQDGSAGAPSTSHLIPSHSVDYYNPLQVSPFSSAHLFHHRGPPCGAVLRSYTRSLRVSARGGLGMTTPRAGWNANTKYRPPHTVSVPSWPIINSVVPYGLQTCVTITEPYQRETVCVSRPARTLRDAGSGTIGAPTDDPSVVFAHHVRMELCAEHTFSTSRHPRHTTAR